VAPLDARRQLMYDPRIARSEAVPVIY